MIDGSLTIGYLHPGSVSHAFSSSLLEVIMFDMQGAQRLFSHDRWRLANEVGSGGIVKGRNQLAEATLESEAEWLFMVDSDMTFGADIVERLIATAEAEDLKVVGALCFASKSDGMKDFDAIRYRSQPTIYDFIDSDDHGVGMVPRFEYARDAVVRCSATGGAAVLIHRAVLEGINEKDGPEWFTPVRHPKGTTFSEDLSFFVRCAGIGEQLAIDTSVKTAHHKGDLWLDEEHYDNECLLRSLREAGA